MKTVYLFRHGDAEDAGAGPDYSRKLTEEGMRMSAEMAAHIKTYGIKFDLIVTSPALRANDTARILAEKCNYPVADIVADELIFTSKKPEDILSIIQKTPEKFSSVMIVGHNPLLSDFVQYVSSRSTVLTMGKSSFVKIEFDAWDWELVLPRSGKVASYKTFERGSITDVIACAQ